MWNYPNIHGDVVATANAAGAKQGGTLSYDPFGQGNPADNLAANFDYGWLGQHQRGTEHASGIATVEMGARQYVPKLGRFLSVDPILGGSSNGYDYANGDPVNGSDLSRTCVDACIAEAAVAAAVVAAAIKGWCEAFCSRGTKSGSDPDKSRIYYRYVRGDEVPQIYRTGLLRGGKPGRTFWTHDWYESAEDAYERLELPQMPEFLVAFRIKKGIIQGEGKTSGGGYQYWSDPPVAVEVVAVYLLGP